MTINTSEIHLSEYRVPDFLIDSVDLTFTLDPTATRVYSRMKCHRQGDHKRPLVLNGDGQKLLSIEVDDQPLDESAYRTVDGGLEVDVSGDTFTVSIENEINPSANTALEGLYLSSGNFCTQCEPEGFRRITYFIDRPDVLARYTVTIIADADEFPVLLSNGNPVSSEPVGEGRHMARWVDPHPKPSYLFALVAGKLTAIRDRFVTASGREVDLAIYVESHNADRCAHAMDSLKKSMRWDEETYGREYDLDVFNIVAVDDFNMGAMENKGLNIFNSRFILAKPETATDTDYDGIESVVAHEYFHNWSGNRVTCRDWFQLSLKEGFTVFRDQEFSADMGSRPVKRIQEVNLLRQVQFSEDAGPQSHPVQPKAYREINNFYTATVYNKGAEVVRMLRNLLGWTKFRAGCDLYFERHDGQAVRIEEFISAMAAVSDVDLTQFRRWYDQSGTPRVTVQTAFEGGVYRLTLSQTCPDTPGQSNKAPFMIPLGFALIGADGQPVSIEGQAEQTLILTESEQTWTFPVTAEQAPVPSLNRGFTAPIEIQYDYSESALATLSAHDTDSFNRWDAFQRLLVLTLLRRIQTAQEQGAEQSAEALPEGVSAAFGRLLIAAEQDPQFVAECLSLPTENYLSTRFDRDVPVELIHGERARLRAQLADEWASTLLLVYKNQVVEGPYAFNAEAVGKRALRRQVLGYLNALPNPAWARLAVEQYDSADNMTESFNALTALNIGESSERDRLIADFGERWAHDPLVMDKWLSLQAHSTRVDALSEVKKLTEHPIFSMKNPNKVRALIGAFARGNPLRFHAADGSGYRWVAERIIELDGINPQIAARIATVFDQWKRYDGSRAEMMRGVLEEIVQRPECSSDLAEIAGKALKG